MKKYSMILFALMAIAFVAPAAFAQTGAYPAAEGTNWVAITSGFAMAIASAACGMAQARATSSACRSPTRPFVSLTEVVTLAGDAVSRISMRKSGNAANRLPLLFRTSAEAATPLIALQWAAVVYSKTP